MLFLTFSITGELEPPLIPLLDFALTDIVDMEPELLKSTSNNY